MLEVASLSVRLFLGIYIYIYARPVTARNTWFERLYDPRMELAVEIVRVVRRRIEYAAKWPMEWLPSVLLPRNSIHRVVTIYEQLVPLPFDPHPRLPQEEDEFIPRDSRGFMRTFLEGDRFERKTVGEMHLGMFLISNWIETRGYSFLTFGNIHLK